MKMGLTTVYCRLLNDAWAVELNIFTQLNSPVVDYGDTNIQFKLFMFPNHNSYSIGLPVSDQCICGLL